jgi:hypothetical protein
MCPKKMDNCFQAANADSPSMRISQMAAASPELFAPALQ